MKESQVLGTQRDPELMLAHVAPDPHWAAFEHGVVQYQSWLGVSERSAVQISAEPPGPALSPPRAAVSRRAGGDAVLGVDDDVGAGVLGRRRVALCAALRRRRLASAR